MVSLRLHGRVRTPAPLVLFACALATGLSVSTAMAQRSAGSPAARPAPSPPLAASAPRLETAPLPPVSREFRGVWVASVANIDWPSKRTLTTAEQQAELILLLDRAAELHLNAIVLQVRPAADALYASTIEPWSEYLTGTQGKAPDPYYDPLAFAVTEAHARGLELHAWFNPYRARHTDAKSPLAASHIARRQPGLVKKYGEYLWMDPGEKAVRERTLKVVLDVVKRYDVDGVHLDDYFYPYPETDRRGRPLDFPDATSWRRYRKGGGTLARDDWRRRNVDLLVQALNEGIHALKPWVKFGISPFGIWRPGFPEQIKGFDSYAKLYADSRKWLTQGWMDYFTPQLYWPTTKAEQAYPVLLQWWVSENAFSRHMWPGNFTSRAAGQGSGAFPVSELVEQLRVTRLQPGAGGNVHFSMKAFLTNQGSINDSLLVGPYQQLALIPSSPWLNVAPAPVPQVTIADSAGASQLTLGTVTGKAPWQWLVRARVDTGWITAILPGSVTRWRIPGDSVPHTLAVNAINRAGMEGDAINALPPDTASSRGDSTKTAAPRPRGRVP